MLVSALALSAIVKVLLETGKNINDMDDSGDTALSMMLSFDCSERFALGNKERKDHVQQIVEILLKYKASLKIGKDTEYSTSVAPERRYERVSPMILAAGMNINSKNENN